MNEISQIFKELERVGYTPYITGGYVRDTVLGVNSKDYDVEVYGCTVEQLENTLARFGKISTVGKRFGIVKLTTETDDYDFSVPRRENKIGVGRSGFSVEFDPSITPQEAAARRDFTFNSMFIDAMGNVFDPYSGRDDLQKHMLRHTSSAFSEDPTRVLRGMRFCGQLDLRPCRDTIRLCKSMFMQYAEIEADMIWQEWEKWANRSVKPSRGLAFLWATQWIHHYPELYNMTRVPQEPEWHPEGSVWQHTKCVVDAMNDICNRDGITGDNKTILMFAALLHDCGKPSTTTTNEHGRIVSPGHDEAGVEIAENFLNRIHMPKKLRPSVTSLVRLHMRHINEITQRTARRFAVQLTDITLADWLAVVEADHSGRPPLPKELPEKAITLASMVQTEEANNRVKELIQGRHLIAAGFKPSALFGVALKRTYDKQIEYGWEFQALLDFAISSMQFLEANEL